MGLAPIATAIGARLYSGHSPVLGPRLSGLGPLFGARQVPLDVVHRRELFRIHDLDRADHVVGRVALSRLILKILLFTREADSPEILQDLAHRRVKRGGLFVMWHSSSPGDKLSRPGTPGPSADRTSYASKTPGRTGAFWSIRRSVSASRRRVSGADGGASSRDGIHRHLYPLR